MAELDFISKFSGEEIDNILDKSQELLNKGYTFSGVATPETDPGIPSLKVFYLTTTAGKYANFDNITVESGKLTVLLYNGSMWQNQVLDLPTSSEPDESFVRYDEEQSLTDTQKDTVLSNIGLKWVNVPYSLLNTTLDDATYTKLTNAYGIILTDAPSEYYGPLEFICGANNSEGTKVFAGLNLANTSAYIVLNVNHKLTNVRYARTYDGAVPYDASKTLTDAQKQQARSNIGVQSADELLADDDFIAQLKTKLGIA